MNKTFKEYLTESKKVYEFKVKLAGDFEKDCATKVKTALSCFNVESCSAAKRTPIQESPADFPTHKNINVTIFDISLSYPATSVQVRRAIAEQFGLSECCVAVRNLKEQEEEEINHAHDEKSGESLLTQDYESNTEGQKLVGEKQKMSLLKDLNKVKHTGEQYKGVNDQLLADSVPSDKSQGPAVTASKINNISTVGSKQVKLPTAKTAGGR